MKCSSDTRTKKYCCGASVFCVNVDVDVDGYYIFCKCGFSEWKEKIISKYYWRIPSHFHNIKISSHHNHHRKWQKCPICHQHSKKKEKRNGARNAQKSTNNHLKFDYTLFSYRAHWHRCREFRNQNHTIKPNISIFNFNSFVAQQLSVFRK